MAIAGKAKEWVACNFQREGRATEACLRTKTRWKITRTQ